MQISDNWGELLLPGLRTLFDKQTKKKKDYMKEIFSPEKSTKAQELNLGTGSLGMMDAWDDTGRQVSYEDPVKGFKATYTHKKFSKGLQIERELLEDDLYGEIKKRIRLLSQSIYFTRQYYAASVFNNAFNATYAGPDGVALCSATHPHAPSDTSVWENASTLDLTADNLETVRGKMMQWRDDKGNLMPIEPNMLLVPVALRKKALVIANSDKEPDMTDNNVNIWRGSIDVMEWPFLTDAGAWFVIDKERLAAFIHWFDRRIAKLEMDRETFDTEVQKYKVVNRFSYGWDEASFVYGCKPA